MGRRNRGKLVAALAVSTTTILTPVTDVVATGPLGIIVDSPLAGAGDCESGSPTCTLASAVDLANDHPGSTIFLSPHTYSLVDTATITADGTTLVGAAPQNAGVAADFTIEVNGRKGLVIDADDVTVSGVTISGASNPNGAGGAIVVKRNSTGFTLATSSIENNHAREGAGLLIDGSATIERSTFVGNAVVRKGGGVRVNGTADIVNSTFTQNSAQSGGAISVAGAAAISFSTFTDNTSNNQKGGGVDRNGGSVVVTGSILSAARKQSVDGSDCSGNPDLIGSNYVGNAQGCQPGPSTLVGTVVGQVGLGDLGAYGGPTATIPIADDSLAVDLVGPSGCRMIGRDGVLDTNDPLVDTDQRGIARPAGDRCDLGAFEVTELQLGLDLSASTTTPFVGARLLPGSAIAPSVIATDRLFNSSLEASPLNAFPLESAPLNAFPLNAFPLNAFPLNSFPLNAFFTAAAPLNAFPLNAFPLNAFPLNAFPLSELVLTEGSWADLLAGTEYEGVPLQSLTLADVSGVPAVGAVDVGNLNLEGTPLNAFPLNAFVFSAIPLNAFPLNAFDASVTDWCDLVPDFCTAGDVDPADDSFTLASLALAGVPLNAFPLNAFPLNAFPLNAFPLNAFPLNAFPLNAFDWRSSPLNAFPLNAFPLNAFVAGTIIDCGAIPGGSCEGASLGDASAAGAIVDGATLGDLGALLLAYPDAFAALGEYTMADLLVGLLPAESIPWNDIDLTVPGLQNAADPEVWSFQYLAALDLSASAAEVTIDVEIPPGFAYVPGGSTLDGTPIDDPVLSCPAGSCRDAAGNRTPVTLAYRLSAVGAGHRLLSIDVRAGFELGTFTASADAAARSTTASDPVVAGPSSTVVDVLAPDQPPDVPIMVATSSTCSADGSGDVNLGWVASATDNVDLYRFDISEAASSCGVRADIFLSNLPADFDVVLYSQRRAPLRDEPNETIPYLDDVTLDLNPFDDIVQADTVQDIAQELDAVGVASDAYAVAAISSNRSDRDERIRTGTLAAGSYYVQVTGYNGARADTPYALRVRTDSTVARGPCDAVPYPAGVPPATLPPLDATLPSGLNTIFLTNSQLFEFTYGSTAAADVTAAATAVAEADTLGVIGAVLAVESDPDVDAAYRARAADPCDPELANDVVRSIGAVIDRYTDARPGIENIVIIGDDRQVPMANIIDRANFANERTFAQDFTSVANNESIAALAAGMYRSDDPYGVEAGIRVRDHELFVPTRAVGRLVESPADIVGALENFINFSGRLDPQTEQRASLQTGYEFLTDGADANADFLEAAGYTVDRTLIDDGWVDDDLVAALSAADPHLDVIGLHAHFDEANALPAFDNFNPPVSEDELFNTVELPPAVDRAVVYSMGCHSGYSVSDVQVGAPAPDWAQTIASDRTNMLAANTGYGYGDTDRVALTEQLTALFAAEVGQNGSIGRAWADAKNSMLRDMLVLDAYQEKALQQFVLYGLPMFHVGDSPPDLSSAAAPWALPVASAAPPVIDSVTGQPISTLTVRRTLPVADPTVPQFDLVTEEDGAYYQIDGHALTVNGHPIQPLYVADTPSYDGLQARDALITELTTIDAPAPFDPLFFWASPNFGGPRPEYSDGSFPAEMSNVRTTRVEGERREQVLLAGGQYRASDDAPNSGTQRLHTRISASVYYTESSDLIAPLISRSTAFADDDAIQFGVEVDPSATRVYVLYRASGQNVWSGLDLVDREDGTWVGVGPFDPGGADPDGEFIVQAVDENGNVSMSNSKSQYFLASVPGDVSALELVAAGDQVNGWFRGDTTVSAVNGGEFVEVRVDAGDFDPYVGPLVLSDDVATTGVLVDTGAHVITAFDEAGGFDALTVLIDSHGPAVAIAREPADVWVADAVAVSISADDGVGSGVDTIEYSLNGANWLPYDGPFEIGETGITTVLARATDVAGNPGPTVSADVRIDSVAPSVTIGVDPATTWSTEPVTVTVTADDAAGSGVASIEYSLDGSAFSPYVAPFGLETDGVYVVSARATDVAGNVGLAQGDDAVTVRIDTTEPIVPTLAVVPSVEIGAMLTADYACADDLSGVATCVLSGAAGIIHSNPAGGTGIVLPTDQLGEFTVTVTATDVAGNITTRDATYTVTDDTPPVVGLHIATANVVLGSSNTADFSCADPESGIESCTVSVVAPDDSMTILSTGAASGTVALPVVAAGTYDVTVTAVNGAGKTAEASGSYSVELCVIELYNSSQPKNIGSNYTITIQLCDAAGRNISSSQIVLTAVSVTGSDGVSFPPGPNDSGNANSMYEFRFAKKRYIYNLDTTDFPFVDPGTYTLNFTTEPVPDPGNPPAAVGRARFTLRL